MKLWRNAPPRRTPDLDLEKLDRNGPEGGAFVFWLIILVWPLLDIVHGRSHPVWLASLALFAFSAVHIAVARTAFDGRVPIKVPVGLLLLEGALTSVSSVAFQHRWFTLWPLLGLATGVVVGHMPRQTKGPELPMLIGIGGVSLLTVVVTRVGGADDSTVLSSLYGVVTAALVTAVLLRLFTVIRMLREAREELAKAAVEQERLRFSRDLHDLLGHTLSLMVVKAQAVRRVAERDPAVAAEQAADIESVGRQALGEVRQAVYGYRGRGLADELDAAVTALSDSGVDAAVRRAGPPLPPEPDALLGWAVREGVTNVIRHSGARRCEITVRNDGGAAVVEISDDGSGPVGGDRPRTEAGLSLGPGGHGLRGLAERMEAAGGALRTGPAPGGGFLLTATVPI
ncbi:sensor histidine kinase [Actinomadura violacea]|uniref:Sensor histidine kinase n=1 Tax=Actinomadura violacea TaxID=2819934 RepID=A0ABS3RT28_9ACTN|nr:sensor histidine kinase [Actinomadura violacea]MBO2459189.1 sensor histidine kinase [Actinomadura violacea]